MQFQVEVRGTAEVKQRLLDAAQNIPSGSVVTYVDPAHCNYAVFVEYGTSKMEPRPFMKFGLWACEDEIDDIVDQVRRGEMTPTEGLNRIGIVVTNKQKDFAPYKTGLMRDNIFYEVLE